MLPLHLKDTVALDVMPGSAIARLDHEESSLKVAAG